MDKFEKSKTAFTDKNLDPEDLEYLQLFSWISGLSFDVYLKKQVIEKLIDDLYETGPGKKKK